MRTAAFITGFQQDPTNTYWGNFIPCRLLATGSPGIYIITLTNQEAIELYSRVSELTLSYNYTVGGVNTSRTVIGYTSVPYVNEQSIECSGSFYLIFNTTGQPVSVTNTPIYYNDTNKEFYLSYAVIASADFRGSPDFVFTVPSALNVTILGQSVTFYEIAGFPVTGTLDISITGYAEYRNSLNNNPVYDSATGTQILQPLPLGF